MSQTRTAINSHAPTLAIIALMIVVGGYAFTDSIADMMVFWRREEYSHAWLLPLLTAMLAHNRLTERRPEIQPSWIGVVLLVVAVAVQIVGELSALYIITQYALLLAILGVLVTFLGVRAVLVIAAPLALLLFTIPLPQFLYSTFSAKLQLLSSNLGVAVLQAFGMSVFQEGNVIDLGVYKLQVVEACSGLRYLFPLMSLSYLVAYLMDDAWWKRIAVFLSAAPVAILMNSLRIAAIGVTVDIWGIEAADGLLHDFEGWSVFLVCVVVLMAEAYLLLKIPPRGRMRMERFALGRGSMFANPLRISMPALVALAGLSLSALAVGTGYIGGQTELVPPRQHFAQFPMTVGEWQGSREVLTPSAIGSLHLTDYVLVDYYPKTTGGIPIDYLPQAVRGEPVNFYAAFYASQRKGAGPHSPQVCIPGDGWRITDIREHSVPGVTTPNGAPLTVNRVVIEKGEVRRLVYYWFVQRDRYLTSEYAVKWYLFWDSLTRNRTDGSLVRVVAPLDSGNGDGLHRSDAILATFLQSFQNVLRVYF